MFAQEINGHRIFVMDADKFPVPMTMDLESGDISIEVPSIQSLADDFFILEGEETDLDNSILQKFETASRGYISIINTQEVPLEDLQVRQMREIVEAAKGKEHAFPQP